MLTVKQLHEHLNIVTYIHESRKLEQTLSTLLHGVASERHYKNSQNLMGKHI